MTNYLPMTEEATAFAEGRSDKPPTRRGPSEIGAELQKLQKLLEVLGQSQMALFERLSPVTMPERAVGAEEGSPVREDVDKPLRSPLCDDLAVLVTRVQNLHQQVLSFNERLAI